MLERINSPLDIKKLNLKQLEELGEELRDFIINTVSKNGGHLASSLGVIELTLALLHEYDFSKDRIVWDVGHQSYPYKILTGRKDRFETIRQYGGLSGFPKISESDFDHFGTGHASTSISAALGMAMARDIKGKKNKVIAVIGDGALTGGVALEGLNNAGFQKSDILIILNDNQMSISSNVGALAQNARRIKNTQAFNDVKNDYKEIKKSIPKSKKKYLDDLKNNLFRLLTPEVFFRKLGFRYSGIIDGHDISSLIKEINELKCKKGPIILHIKTKKGKGYEHAENDCTTFHGIGSFDRATGKKNGSCELMSYGKSFSEILIKLASKNNKICAITAAMPTGTCLDAFAKRFPSRFFDVGIAEQHAVTFAAGLASQGFIPVVAIYSTFLQRAFDQVIHDVALQNLPVIFAIDRGGLVGDDGPTHHGSFDLSYLQMIPNLVVMAPKDEMELHDMFYSAVRYKKPVAIRYPRGYGYGVCIEEPKFIDIGESELIERGDDLVLVGIGSTVNKVMRASHEVNGKISVVNARFVKPVDERLVNHINRVKKAIVVEENSVIGGLGSYLKSKCKASIEIIGLPDRFIEHGPVDILLDKYGISVDNIVRKARRFSL